MEFGTRIGIKEELMDLDYGLHFQFFEVKSYKLDHGCLRSSIYEFLVNFGPKNEI